MKHFRKGTWDETISRIVIRENEYKVDYFSCLKVVVDIGCHIGSFSWLAASKGAGKVIGFEACTENYELAKRNLESLQNVEIRNQAVWRSDKPPQTLFFRPSDNPVNTGGGGVLNKTGVFVQSISLDDILNEVGEIDLLKMDCEGSEFPILLTCRNLKKVRRIVGEYHNNLYYPSDEFKIEGFSEFTINSLSKYLISVGFTVTSRADNNTGSCY